MDDSGGFVKVPKDEYELLRTSERNERKFMMVMIRFPLLLLFFQGWDWRKGAPVDDKGYYIPSSDMVN